MPRRILVIDDAPDLRKLYQEILEDEGFEVTTSACDLPAHQEVVRMRPSAIIVDCMLGSQPPGLQFLHQIKANALTYDIPVILATTAEQITFDKLGPFLHQVTVLHKPFALDDLLTILEHA